MRIPRNLVMYPMLFTLSTKDLDPYTKTGLFLLIIHIVGGTLVPPTMGLISDVSMIKYAFLVPLLWVDSMH